MSTCARIIRDDNVFAIVDSDAVILVDNGVISYAENAKSVTLIGRE
jgi:hypothetical protein